MTASVLLAAFALVRPAEYPFRSADYVPPPLPVRYFVVTATAAPRLIEEPRMPPRPDPERVHEHVIEGRELRAFWQTPDPEPWELPDPPADYNAWLKRHVEEMGKSREGARLCADELVSEFVKTRSGDLAFEIFLLLTAEGNKQNPYTKWTPEEADYFLRFAANHGSVRARQFFDGEGEIKTGRAYEYVFAEYSPNYRVRRPYPYDLAGAPGSGMPGAFRLYDADDALKDLMSRHSLVAMWFDLGMPKPPDPNAEEYVRAVARHRRPVDRSCDHALPPSLPFLAYRPKTNSDDSVPLVVYMPGSGEQGEDLKLQFRQTACLAKVTSSAFQARHPAYFLVIAPPEYGNVNCGYGYPFEAANRVNEAYNDLVLAYARAANAPRIDPDRIYLTGLGSGATIAMAMALDHPGRFAAVAPVWAHPYSPIVHPENPGNWRFYNLPRKSDDARAKAREYWDKLKSEFTANVRAGGGDCAFVEVPRRDDADGVWWDRVWTSDELWEWMFSKRAGSLGQREQ